MFLSEQLKTRKGNKLSRYIENSPNISLHQQWKKLLSLASKRDSSRGLKIQENVQVGLGLSAYITIVIFATLTFAIHFEIFETFILFTMLNLPVAFLALRQNKTRPVKDAVDARPESDLRFRTLIDHAPEAIVVYDAKKGNFVDANRNALRLFDYDLPTLLKLGPLDVSPHTQPSGVSSKRMASEKIKEALKGGTPVFEWTHQNRHGELIPCEVRLVLLPANGKQLIRGSVVDIRPRKQYESEHQKRLATENQRREELAGLALAGASISSTLELDKVLEIVAKQLSNLLDVQICIVLDWTKNANKLLPRLEHISLTTPPAKKDFQPKTLIKHISLKSGPKEPSYLQKLVSDSRLPSSEREAMRVAGITKLVLLPLVAKGRTIGYVELQDTRTPRPFSEHEIYLAQTLCQQAAIAIENARLFQSTRRQLEELTILKEVAIASTEATNEDELISRATHLIRDGLYPDNFGVLLLAETGKELFIHSSYEADKSIKENRIRLGHGVTGRVAASGQPLRVADTREETDYLDFDQTTRSELCVPMKIGERVIGVVNAESHESNHFAEADERLLLTFAGLLASGIERLRKEEAERQKTKQLRVLNELTGEMSGILDRAQLFNIVVDRLHDRMDYYTAYVFSIDEDSNEVILEAARGAFEKLYPDGEYRQSMSVGLLGKAARTGEAVISNNVKKDPDYFELGGMEEVNSELAIPIRIYKKTVALLNVDCEKPNAFDVDEVAALKTLADQISIALESINLFDATRRQLQELTVLHAIANSAVSAKSEDELLERATEVIGATLYPDKFGFLLIDENEDCLVIHPSYRGIEAETKNLRIPLSQGITGRVAATQKPWLVSDVRKEPSYMEVNPMIRSELCVPFADSQKVLGVINAESVEVGAFTDADLRLLSTIAGQLGTAIEKLRLFESERLQRDQAETLQEVATILGAVSDIREVSDLILEQLKHVVPFDSASIQIVEGEVLSLKAIAGTLSKDLIGHELPIKDDKLAHPILNDQQTVLYGDIGDHPDWLQVPGASQVKSWIGAPLIVRGECIGVLTVDGYATNQFDEADAQLVSSFAIHAGIAIENARLFGELEDSFTQTVSALANAIDVRDSYTNGHSQRLAKLAVETGRVLGCSNKELEDIYWAALLHDIGKIGVPDRILRKPSALAPQELEIIRQHPEIGARIVEPVKTLERLAPIIRAHQERYDGEGYPDGLSGKQIPEAARIISVADAYVAMTDERVYRKAYSHEEAMEELKRCSGSQFDPEIIEAFLQIIEEHRSN